MSTKTADVFLSQPAQFTPDQIDAMERNFTGPSLAMARRMALGTLTRSAAQLVESIEAGRDTAKAFAEAAQLARQYAEMLREFAGFMDTAANRIGIALIGARTDGAAICRRAKFQPIIVGAARS